AGGRRRACEASLFERRLIFRARLGFDGCCNFLVELTAGKSLSIVKQCLPLVALSPKDADLDFVPGLTEHHEFEGLECVFATRGRKLPERTIARRHRQFTARR